MFSRFVAIALMLLVPCAACTKKEDNTTLDPGGPVVIPPVNRDVVDAGLVILDMDADVYGPGGSPGINIPDAGPRPDLARGVDASVDSGGVGAVCDVFAAKPCGTGLGCYPKADGTGTCKEAGFLFGGSSCEPTESSVNSRCMPGYTCVSTPSKGIPVCAALCHLGAVSTRTCADSVGTTCVRLGVLDSTIGFCD